MAVEDDTEEKFPPYGEGVVKQMAFYIQFLHRGSPDFALSDDEAMGLAKAIAGVARYHIKLKGGGGRTGAYLALIGTSAMVYGPKVMAKAARDRARATPPPPSEPATMQ